MYVNDPSALLLSRFIEGLVSPEVRISANSERSEVQRGPSLLNALQENLPIAEDGMVKCWHTLTRKVLLSTSDAPSALAPSVALSVLGAWLGASNRASVSLDQIHRHCVPDGTTDLPNRGLAGHAATLEARCNQVVSATEETGQRIAKAIVEALPPERQRQLPPIPATASAVLQTFVSTHPHSTNIHSLISWSDASLERMGNIPCLIVQQPTGKVAIPTVTRTGSPIPFRFGLLGPSASSVLGPILATALQTLAAVRKVNLTNPRRAHSQANLLSNLLARSSAALNASRTEELLTRSERSHLDAAVEALSVAALLDTSGSRSFLGPQAPLRISPFSERMGDLFESQRFLKSLDLLERRLAEWDEIPREIRKELAVVAASLSDIDGALAQFVSTRTVEPLQTLHWHFYAASMLEARGRHDSAGAFLRRLLAAYFALRAPFDVAFVKSAGKSAAEIFTGLQSVFPILETKGRP